MTDLDTYRRELREFVAQRGWDKFQNPKDLAMALGGETGELLALLQWLTPEEAARRSVDDAEFRRELSYEMADILNYLLRLADSAEIDLLAAAEEKLAVNVRRYPAHLVQGKAVKYNQINAVGGAQ